MNLRLSPELLSAYYDGELSPEAQAEVARQLEVSDREENSNRTLLKDFTRLSELLEELPASQPSVDFSAQVMHEIELQSLLPPVGTHSQNIPRLVKKVESNVRTNSVWKGTLAVAVSALSLLAMVQLLSWNSVENGLNRERDLGKVAEVSTTSPQHSVVAMREESEKFPGIGDLTEKPTFGDEFSKKPFSPTEVSKEFNEQSVPEGEQQSLMDQHAEIADNRKPQASHYQDEAVDPARGKLRRALPVFDRVTPDSKSSHDYPGNLNLAKSPTDGKDVPQWSNESAPNLQYSQNLKNAEIGQVVEALETYQDRVAVVRLTVIDKKAGVHALEMLLARNSNRKKSQQEQRTSGGLEEKTNLEKTEISTYEVVLVEATKQELSSTLNDLKREIPGHKVAYNNSITIAQLDQLASARQLESFGYAGAFEPNRSTSFKRDSDSQPGQKSQIYEIVKKTPRTFRRFYTVPTKAQSGNKSCLQRQSTDSTRSQCSWERDPRARG